MIFIFKLIPIFIKNGVRHVRQCCRNIYLNSFEVSKNWIDQISGILIQMQMNGFIFRNHVYNGMKHSRDLAPHV